LGVTGGDQTAASRLPATPRLAQNQAAAGTDPAAHTRAASFERPARTVITISAIGDCAIGDLRRGGGAPGSFSAVIAEHDDPMAYPFSATAHIFRNDDLTIANFEGTLTESRGVNNDVFAVRGKPEWATMLIRAGVELVDIDNNHSGDYGLQGLRDTKQALTAAGVGYFGRKRVDRRTIKGIDVVNLGYLGGPRGTRERVVQDIQRERPNAGLVIVSFHWGVEAFAATHPDQVSLGRAAIDAGADLVLGHHPHVLQGIETYKGRHIVYSLANFVFGANVTPVDMDSMIYQERFTLADGKLQDVEQTIIPVRISSARWLNDFRPVILQGSERDRVLKKIAKLTRRLPR